MEKIVDRNIDLGEFIPQPDDDVIVCRCEEVTKGEIRRAVHDGMRDLSEIRRYLRTGMGLCQGLTCGKLVQAIVARELGVRPNELETNTARTPARPIEMSVYEHQRRCDHCRRRYCRQCHSLLSVSEGAQAPGSGAQSDRSRRLQPERRRCSSVRP